MTPRILSDEQWDKIKGLLPSERTKGRRRIDNREVLEGILWILKTGAQWRYLPKDFPSASTCWRRLRDWEEQDIWLEVWRCFLRDLDEQQSIDWSESFMDGSFAPAKKGGLVSERPRKAKAQSGWWWSTAKVFLWEANLPQHLPPK